MTLDARQLELTSRRSERVFDLSSSTVWSDSVILKKKIRADGGGGGSAIRRFILSFLLFSILLYSIGRNSLNLQDFFIGSS